MVWIFALGIIVLAAFHRGFRTIVLSLISIAALSFVAMLGWQTYQVHGERIEQAKADTVEKAKESAFVGELRKYCNAAEIGTPASSRGLAQWVPLALTAGESPAAFAREQHCAGASAIPPTAEANSSGLVPSSRGVQAPNALPAWAVEWDRLQKGDAKHASSRAVPPKWVTEVDQLFSKSNAVSDNAKVTHTTTTTRSDALGNSDAQNLKLQDRIASATEGQESAAIAAAVVAAIGTAIAGWALWFLRNTYYETQKTAAAADRTAQAAHREFIATHRPKLLIRQIHVLSTFEKGGETCLEIECMVANIGSSEGTLIESSYGLEFSDGKAFGDFSKESFPQHKLQAGAGLKNRSVAVLTDAAAAGMAYLEETEGRSGRTLYFRGYLLYTDENAVARRTYFLRRYDYNTRRFWPTDDPEYDHAD